MLGESEYIEFTDGSEYIDCICERSVWATVPVSIISGFDCSEYADCRYDMSLWATVPVSNISPLSESGLYSRNPSPLSAVVEGGGETMLNTNGDERV